MLVWVQIDPFTTFITFYNAPFSILQCCQGDESDEAHLPLRGEVCEDFFVIYDSKLNMFGV